MKTKSWTEIKDSVHGEKGTERIRRKSENFNQFLKIIGYTNDVLILI